MIFIFNLPFNVMKVKIEKTSLGDFLKVNLDKGESFFAEPGVVVSMEPGVEIKSNIHGGLVSGALRAFAGGESAVINQLIAEKPTTVELAPNFPGSIVELDLDGEMFLGDGVYMAHSGDIEISAKFGGLSSLATGSGLAFSKAKGKGKLYLNSGAILKHRKLKKGEEFFVDNTSFIAAPSNMTMEKHWVGKGLFSKLTSGEGVMIKFVGPGEVYYTTGSFANLLSMLASLGRR